MVHGGALGGSAKSLNILLQKYAAETGVSRHIFWGNFEMKFLQAYKRLDNLCRDMNGSGVTRYLEDMEQLLDGERRVPGWKDDYLQLKHYHSLQNRIVHEVNAEEENLCSTADVAWLEAFYGRILGTSDPLALYRKAVTPPPVSDQPAISSKNDIHTAGSSCSSNEKPTPMHPGPQRPQQPSPPRTGCALWLLFVFCIAMFFLSELFR